MQNEKKSSISLWVGVLALGLTFISVIASAEDTPEDELKKTLGQLIGGGSQDGDTNKLARCEDSAIASKKAGNESRSIEELTSICLALPNSHEASCGFPASSDEYFVVENQQCVSKMAGRSQLHAQARKVEARERPVDGSYDYDQGDDDTGTTRGAQ